MKSYAAFYDDVMPELPGCELAMALHTIKRACNDFYERSLFSRETVTINVVAGTGTYLVAPVDSANFEVGKILYAKFNDGGANPKRLYAKPMEWLEREMPSWNTKTGPIKFYTQQAMDSISLAYTPDASQAGAISLTIAKLPLYAGGGVDDAVFEKYAEAIGAGVKGRLMMMPKKPWSNPQLGAFYMGMFNNEVASAAVVAARSYGAGALRTRAWG